MSLLKLILKGITAFFSGALILPFIQFATAILVIRWLGRVDYGKLALSLSIYATASILLDPGIGSLIVSQVAKERGEQRLGKIKYFLVRYGQIEIGLGFVLLFITFFGSYWVSDFITKEIVLLIGAYLFFAGIKNIFINTFYSYALYHYQVLLEVLSATFRLILVILLLGWIEMGLVGAMLTYPLSLVLAIVTISPFWLKTVKYLRKIKIQSTTIMPPILMDQGKFAILFTITKTIQDQIPVWIVKAILGMESVAIYGVAQRAFSFIFSFYKTLESTIFPLASEMINSQWSRVKEMFIKGMKYSFLISLLVVPVLWIAAHSIFGIAFSEKYIASVPVFRLFLLLLFIYSFTLVPRPLFYALGLLKYHFYSLLPSISIYPLILWIFISEGGVSGAGWAIIINSIVIGLLRYYFLRKNKPDFKIRIRSLFWFDALEREIFGKGWRNFSKNWKV
jgi:O-antigen/teichoic acid export membrane protein